MKVFLNSKTLYKCQAFQLISRQPRVPKLCWVSLPSSAFPSIYRCSCKNSGIPQPSLATAVCSCQHRDISCCGLGLVKLDVLSEAVYLRDTTLRWCMKCSWELDSGMPSNLLTGVVAFSVFLRQWFFNFSNFSNGEIWYHLHEMVAHS